MTRIKSILHPTDFSDQAQLAYRLACSLARDYGAKLLLVHVRQLAVPLAGEAAMLPPQPPPEEEDALRDRLYALRPDDPRLAVEHYLLLGDPAEETVRLAAEKGCDLIVLGTHGRTGLARLLMGSVAEHVVRLSPCPVMLVKQPKTATTSSSRRVEMEINSTTPVAIL
jgi:nucleotide-binding universal stress UspA family protein